MKRIAAISTILIALAAVLSAQPIHLTKNGTSFNAYDFHQTVQTSSGSVTYLSAINGCFPDPQNEVSSVTVTVGYVLGGIPAYQTFIVPATTGVVGNSSLGIIGYSCYSLLSTIPVYSIKGATVSIKPVVLSVAEEGGNK